MLVTITAIVGTIISVATFVVGISQYRRSVHMNIFRTYADKYNSIVTPEIYDKWQDALRGTKDNWEELTPYMIQYLNLIWEEVFLYKSNVIPHRLWKIWLPEIQAILMSDFARAIIKKYDFHFPERLSL